MRSALSGSTRASSVIVNTIFFFFLLNLFLVNTSYAFSVSNQLITSDPKQGSGCSIPMEKIAFSPTDEKVFFWVSFQNASTADNTEWKWFSPDNSLYLSVKSASSFSSGCMWHSIQISDQPAAEKPGTWRVEFHVNNTLLASDTFTIGVQQAGPKISFNPPSGSKLISGQVFDFSIIGDFGAVPQVTSFAISHQDNDMTQAFINAYKAGYVKVSSQGNIATATIPGQSLLAGRHKVSVTVGSSGGATHADWIVDVSPPTYTLSADQKALIASNRKPAYMTVLFNADPQRREEVWVYPKLGKMFVFWDGTRQQEKSVTIDPTLRSEAPSTDPSLFTKDTKLSDLIYFLGDKYTVADQWDLDSVFGVDNFKTYFFSEKGLFASFVDDNLVVVKTIDLPRGQEALNAKSQDALKMAGAVRTSSSSGLKDSDYRSIFLLNTTLVALRTAGLTSEQKKEVNSIIERCITFNGQIWDLDTCRSAYRDAVDKALEYPNIRNESTLTGLGLFLLVDEDETLIIAGADSPPPGAYKYSGKFGAPGSMTAYFGSLGGGSCNATVDIQGDVFVEINVASDGVYTGTVDILGSQLLTWLFPCEGISDNPLSGSTWLNGGGKLMTWSVKGDDVWPTLTFKGTIAESSISGDLCVDWSGTPWEGISTAGGICMPLNLQETTAAAAAAAIK